MSNIPTSEGVVAAIGKPLTHEDGCCSNLVVRTASTSINMLSPRLEDPKKPFKYMECLKNHAAAIGGNATDGCGEFIAGGEPGTLEALKCSACNCHRNFHRKIHIQPTEPANSQCYTPAGVMMRKSSSIVYGAGAEVGVAVGQQNPGEREVKKRFRTKFSEEQKHKMQGFAEKGGWKIQKMDDSEVRRFCQEIGIKRKVLKVWMHNNKYHHFPKKSNTISSLTTD